MKLKINVGVLCLLVWVSNNLLAFTGQKLVQGELISNFSGVSKNSSFDLGIKLKIEDGWHIYWSYPGDLGLPTEVVGSSNQPVAFKEVQMPMPSVFTQSGGAIGYGYEKETFFILPVEVGAIDQPLQITAKIKYLGCGKSQCVPGSLELSLTIPIDSQPKLINQEIYENFERSRPIENLVGQDFFITKVTEDPWSVQLEWKTEPSNLVWVVWPARKAQLEKIKYENTTSLSSKVSAQYKPDLTTQASFRHWLYYEIAGQSKYTQFYTNFQGLELASWPH